MRLGASNFPLFETLFSLHNPFFRQKSAITYKTKLPKCKTFLGIPVKVRYFSILWCKPWLVDMDLGYSCHYTSRCVVFFIVENCDSIFPSPFPRIFVVFGVDSWEDMARCAIEVLECSYFVISIFAVTFRILVVAFVGLSRLILVRSLILFWKNKDIATT
mgnify:CR=1 FL=1